MYELTAYLCGHFHRDKEVTPQQLAQEQWNLWQFDDTEIVSLKRMFYAELIDFFSNRCVLMRKQVDSELLLPFRGSPNRYHVDELALVFVLTKLFRKNEK